MKTILLLAALALRASLPAQFPVSSHPVAVTGGFFALSVADLKVSADWYRERLGLRVVKEVPKTGPVAATILEGDGLIVELVQHDEAVPLSTAAPGSRGDVYIHGIFKVGVIVNDFEATLAMLRARQVEIAYGPYPAGNGQRANVIVKDNAGNLIQFFGQ